MPQRDSPGSPSPPQTLSARQRVRQNRLRKAAALSALFRDSAFGSTAAKATQPASSLPSPTQSTPDIETLPAPPLFTPSQERSVKPSNVPRHPTHSVPSIEYQPTPPVVTTTLKRRRSTAPSSSTDDEHIVEPTVASPNSDSFISDRALLEMDVPSSPSAAGDFLSDQALLDMNENLPGCYPPSTPSTGPSRASSPRLKVVGPIWRGDGEARFTGLYQATQQQLSVFLRDEWVDTHIVEGDIFRVVLVTANNCFGDFPDQFDQLDVVINAELNLLIVHPDTLINGTTVADSFGCPRRSVLSARHMSSRDSAPALIGTVVHELFQLGLRRMNLQGSRGMGAYLRSAIPDLLVTRTEKLYGLQLSEDETLKTVSGAIPSMTEWLERFFSPKGGEAWEQAQHLSNYSVSSVLDVEETAWSPVLGLKGKFDATVNLTATENNFPAKAVVELKTGKCGGIATTFHKAQVVLYNFLMSDVYEARIEYGMLSYIQTKSDPRGQNTNSEMISTSFSVLSVRPEVAGLIMARNELARFLRIEDSPESDKLPPMLEGQPNVCNNCFSADACMMQHKLLEGGNNITANVGPGSNLFHEKAGALTSTHAEYYTNMRKILRYEEAHAMQFRRELWTVTPDEREASGRCTPNLHLTKTRAGRGSRITHNFSRSSFSSWGPAPGEYVLASLQRCGNSVPKYSVSSGFVKSVDRASLTVDLNSDLIEWAKNHSLPATDCVWRIDKEEIAASFNIARENLELLFRQDEAVGSIGCVDKLRRLVVDLDTPVFSRRSDITTPSGLNVSQREAIQAAFGAKDYTLILGMPGTGKTGTLAGLIATAVSRSMTVLLCSHTHSAVDTVLLRLQGHNVHGKPVNFLRLGRADQIDERLHEHLLCRPVGLSTLSANAEELTTRKIHEQVDASPVIATTCLGVGNPILSRKSFDIVVIDEAGQISQSICFGPLRLARKSFVLCGDHYQLSPLLRSSLAVESGGDISLFRRLCEAHPSAIFSLSEQYRMSEDVMSLANELVYDGRLKCGNSSVANRKLPLDPHSVENLTDRDNVRSLSLIFPWVEQAALPATSVSFVNTDGLAAKEDEADDQIRERHGGSARNETEALVALTCVAGLIGVGAKASDMCVISPYRAQLAILRKAKRVLFSGALSEIDCLTIDQAQGQDRECVVVSFVRSNESRNVGQLLQDWRRLNVALTRAKSKLILVGSASTLQGGEFTKSLVTLTASKGWMTETRQEDIDLLPNFTSTATQPQSTPVLYRSPNIASRHLTARNALGEHKLGGF